MHKRTLRSPSVLSAPYRRSAAISLYACSHDQVLPQRTLRRSDLKASLASSCQTWCHVLECMDDKENVVDDNEHVPVAAMPTLQQPTKS